MEHATATRPTGGIEAGPGGEEQLRANSIGLVRVVGFTAGIIGPAAAVVLGLVVAFSLAGFATPFVVAVALIGALCTANSVAEFARRIPSAGGLYAYNADGLGPRAGFVTGWLIFFCYLTFVPAGLSASATFISAFLDHGLHITLSDHVLFFVLLAVVAYVAWRGITLSANLDLAALAIETAVILALAITILVSVGVGHWDFGVFNPANTLNGKFSDLSLSLIFVAVAFSGFEAAAVLAEESEQPKTTIPRGLYGSLILVGVFYLVVMFAEMQGVGQAGVAKLAASGGPIQELTTRYWSSSVVWLVDLVVAVSAFGFTLAGTNAVARGLFAMGRDRVLPGALARTGRHDTPEMAIAAVMVLTLLIGTPLLFAVGAFNTFAYLGTIAGLALVACYLLVNVSLIRAFRGRYRKDFHAVRHGVVPLVGVAIFCFPLVGNFYPKPAYPYDFLPYITIAWAAVGVLVAVLLAAREPERMRAIGRVFSSG